MRWILIALAFPIATQAAVYKCPGADGRVTFSDRPCGGSAESPEHRIELTPAPRPGHDQKSRSQAERKEEWEGDQHFYHVEIPQLEREAMELMASPDPARQSLGREMAWKAQQGRQAFKELEQARERREETTRRYDDALRRLR